MIYWGRFACDAGNDSNIAEQMATSGNSVKLIRNHARISSTTRTITGIS